MIASSSIACLGIVSTGSGSLLPDRVTKRISPAHCNATQLRRAAKVAQAVSLKVALWFTFGAALGSRRVPRARVVKPGPQALGPILSRTYPRTSLRQ